MPTNLTGILSANISASPTVITLVASVVALTEVFENSVNADVSTVVVKARSEYSVNVFDV